MSSAPTYDALAPATRSFVQGADPQHPSDRNPVWERTVYGEGQPDDVQLNLRAKPFRQSSTARASSTSDELRLQGQSAAEQPPAGAGLQDDSRLAAESGSWSRRRSPASTTYDALNRPDRGHRAGRQRLSADLQRSQPARQGRCQAARRAGAPRRRSSPTSTTTPRASACVIEYGNGAEHRRTSTTR